tara:strand:+ start:906 stop:1616 length:711 start_codon:yes stop_codon:yes gene_type:complete
MKISIIIPAYNEEGNIIEVITEIEKVLDIEHELIVVNDHSTDKTKALVEGLLDKYKNLRLVDNKKQPGFANALLTGFAQASSEILLPVMGDLCDDLSTIKIMYDKINEGYDIVCGSRYMPGGSQIGSHKFKAFLSCLGGRVSKLILGIHTQDISNAFKMYRKKIFDEINLEAQSFDISFEIPVKAHFKGFKITQVPTTWKGRTKGESSFKVFSMLSKYIKIFFWALWQRLNFKKNA